MPHFALARNHFAGGASHLSLHRTRSIKVNWFFNYLFIPPGFASPPEPTELSFYFVISGRLYPLPDPPAQDNSRFKKQPQRAPQDQHAQNVQRRRGDGGN